MPIDLAGLEQRMRTLAAQRLLKDMLKLQAAHKRNLSRANPRPHKSPAKKGEYPKARTLNLRDAVVVEPRDLATLTSSLRGRVGVLVNAEYGYILEQAGWKGLLDTHESLKQSGAYG